jgi:hypothetical protein
MPALGGYAKPTVAVLNSQFNVQQSILLAIDSAQKYQGAIQAGNVQYANLHAALYQTYIRMLPQQLDTLRMAIKKFDLYLKSREARRKPLNSEALDEIKSQAEAGIPIDVQNFFSQIGIYQIFTDAQIQQIITEDATVPRSNTILRASNRIARASRKGLKKFRTALAQ